MVSDSPRVIRVISLMSPALSITPLTPPPADRASAYFAGQPDAAEFFVWRRRSRPLASGQDDRMQPGAIVLPGRPLGTGAVIAAGTPVSKEVMPNTIVADNPARPARQRYPGSIERSARSGLPARDRSHEQLRCVLGVLRKLPLERSRGPYEQSMAEIQEK